MTENRAAVSAIGCRVLRRFKCKVSSTEQVQNMSQIKPLFHVMIKGTIVVIQISFCLDRSQHSFVQTV
jgi:hypothetical protein